MTDDSARLAEIKGKIAAGYPLMWIDSSWLLARLEQAESERDAARETTKLATVSLRTIANEAMPNLMARLEQAERERDALGNALGKLLDDLYGFRDTRTGQRMRMGSHFAVEWDNGAPDDSDMGATYMFEVNTSVLDAAETALLNCKNNQQKDI